MILQKVLAAGRPAAVRKVISPASDTLAVARRNKFVGTPSTEKISSGEAAVLSILIPCAVVSVPAWIVCHLREYGSAN